MTTVRELVIKVNFEGNAKEESKSLVGGLADVKAGFDLLVSAGKFAAQAIASFTTDIANQGDAIAKSAANIGISAEALQELTFAAEISGSSMGTLTKTLQFVSKGLNDAREKGTGPFIDGLDQIGVSLDELEGLSPDEIFTKLADSLSRVEDETTKSGAAQNLFSKGAKELLPLINEGAAGINKLRKEFVGMGGGFRDDGAKAAEEFNDAMLRMDTVIDSVKIAVGVELLPVIQEIIDEIRVWAQDNREAVTEQLVDFVKDLTDALKKMGPTLKKVLPLIEDFALFTAKAIEETGFMIDNIDLLDEKLTQDFGPAWEHIKMLMEATLVPFKLMGQAFDDLTTGSDSLGGKLGGLLAPLRGLIALARKLTGATPEGETEGGVRITGKKETAGFLSEGGGVKVIEGMTRLDAAKTQSELRAIADDDNESGPVRALAVERINVAQAEDAAFVDRELINESADLRFVETELIDESGGDPTDRPRRRGKKKGKKKETEKVKAEELQKLISVAAAEGIGLESVLGGREIEGGTPPVISVNIINNDQKINVAVDLTVNGVPGEVAEDVAQRVIGRFEDLLSVEFRDAMEEATPKESR